MWFVWVQEHTYSIVFGTLLACGLIGTLLALALGCRHGATLSMRAAESTTARDRRQDPPGREGARR